MAAHSHIEAAQLAKDLRYIDITFECLTRAKRIVDRVDGWEGPKFSDELPSPRSQRIGRIMGRLRAKQCAREGAPDYDVWAEANGRAF